MACVVQREQQTIDGRTLEYMRSRGASIPKRITTTRLRMIEALSKQWQRGDGVTSHGTEAGPGPCLVSAPAPGRKDAEHRHANKLKQADAAGCGNREQVKVALTLRDEKCVLGSGEARRLQPEDRRQQKREGWRDGGKK